MRLQPREGCGFIGRPADRCSEHRGCDARKGSLEDPVLETFQVILFRPGKRRGRLRCRQIPPGDTGGGFKRCFHDITNLLTMLDVTLARKPGPGLPGASNGPQEKRKTHDCRAIVGFWKRCGKIVYSVPPTLPAALAFRQEPDAVTSAAIRCWQRIPVSIIG